MSEVRRASAADADQVAGVHVAVWRETYADFLPATMLEAMTFARRHAHWQTVLSDQDSDEAVFVAEACGRVVGFASCGPQRSEILRQQGLQGEVNTLYVLADYRRLGLGAKLMDAMSAHLVRNDVPSIGVWVLEANVPARRFYETFDARSVGRQAQVRFGAEIAEVAYGLGLPPVQEHSAP